MHAWVCMGVHSSVCSFVRACVCMCMCVCVCDCVGEYMCVRAFVCVCLRLSLCAYV